MWTRKWFYLIIIKKEFFYIDYILKRINKQNIIRITKSGQTIYINRMLDFKKSFIFNFVLVGLVSLCFFAQKANAFSGNNLKNSNLIRTILILN